MYFALLLLLLLLSLTNPSVPRRLTRRVAGGTGPVPVEAPRPGLAPTFLLAAGGEYSWSHNRRFFAFFVIEISGCSAAVQ